MDRKIIDRFWGFVVTDSDCWIWAGSKVKSGLGGRLIVDGQEYTTRRLSYEIRFGETIPGKGIHLSCDEVMCVKPEHLLHGDDVLFWRQVNKDGPIIRPELGPCWEWMSHRDSKGYGRCHILPKERRAYRTSWILTHGPLEPKVCVLHKCDNPPCVRPDHLFLGDRTVNNADRHAKERDVRGERSPFAKLTEEQVLDILAEEPCSEAQYLDLAERYGVARTTIWNIAHRLRWKHVA